ncbi:hypothetical protein JTE90_023417, partial [Oedothorax gibbosus]
MVTGSKCSCWVALVFVLVFWSASSVQGDRERLRALVHVCTGHDLYNAIQKACGVKRKRNDQNT